MVTVGCGGASAESAPTAAPRNAPSADAGAAPNASAPVVTNVTLPAERPVPPLGLGSKIARVRGRGATDPIGDPPLPACAAKAASGAPDAIATALLRACEPSMKAAGAAQPITIGEHDPGATVTFDAKPGCQRIFVGLGANVEDVVVSVLDSKGLLAAQARSEPGAHAMVIPPDGPLCFDVADAAKVIVSAGRGQGAGSVQIAHE